MAYMSKKPAAAGNRGIVKAETKKRAMPAKSFVVPPKAGEGFPAKPGMQTAAQVKPTMNVGAMAAGVRSAIKPKSPVKPAMPSKGTGVRAVAPAGKAPARGIAKKMTGRGR